ncbi:MFS general substrate transporter [Myriangium duriaei CBS 260.36]|uniref:MFS general substrate transporter n=1 Tax=Myriangium duriaei CBS 260.36 TaxID=1168546 RepID=A0A9P4MIC0_9PEZI|nr:MFS general substrate transporter [Myriangium duriaei CBS 260.36]
MSASSSDPEHDDSVEHSKEVFCPSRKNSTDAQSPRPEHSTHSSASNHSQDGGTDSAKEVISFADGDPEDPHNWSNTKKCFVVFLGVILVINSTIGSSIASGTPVQVADYFDNHNEYQLVLPISIYLVGYVLGPLAFGPLSESYGRKWVMIATFGIFTVFTLGCALAPAFASYIVFRLLVGIGASSPISVVGGIYADVYRDPTTRGRAMSIFMTATTWGPLIGPIVSGFVSPALGWRWVYWIALIIAGFTWPVLLFSPETYGPTILARRAAHLRRTTNNPNIYSPQDLESRSLRSLCTTVLTRPVRMFLFEPLVLFTCAYLGFAYAIFYMFFQAYPIIYPSTYAFNTGETGLAFIPVGIGSIVACALYLYWDHLLLRAKAADRPWARIEEYRRLPLACLGGPAFVISLFWIGWTARPDVHWIVPILSALPFGIGFLLLFMALLNYLVDAYDVYAASATAASACSRSLFGAVLPFAAKPMYRNLGVPWACSLLGFLSLALCVIPFVFLKYGDALRRRSKFCQELKRIKEEEEEEERRRGSGAGERRAGRMSGEEVEVAVEGQGPLEAEAEGKETV